MSYSMLGLGVNSSCEGAASAGADFRRSEADAKSACAKAVELRQKVNRLTPIVEEQKGLFSSELTPEQVELYQAKQALPAASAACDSSIARKGEALKRFIDFQAAGCFAPGGAPPVRTGVTTVEHVGRDNVLVLPEVVIEAEEPVKSISRKTGGGYSAASCPPNPKRTQEGQKGQSVFCWQKFLIGQGFALSADADHGVNTERASKEFEARKAPVPVVEPPKPVAVIQEKPKTASVMPQTILGLPTNVALAGAAALLVGGAVFFLRPQKEGVDS